MEPAHLPPRPSNPCVVYKPITTVGGLELYLAETASAIDAPIYTLFQSQSLSNVRATPDVVEFEKRDAFHSVLERLPVGTLVQTLEYEQFEVPKEYDAVVTIGEVTKSVIHQPHQRRYHVLNMPPRWLFDLGPGKYDDSVGPVKWLKRLYQSYMRVHDISTVSRITDFVVPSETIARRLETYYDRTPTAVIYPPVYTDQYYFEENAGYLLYVGRLSRAKRVGEIVDALSGTDYRLKIAGTGPTESEVKRRAGQNVEMLGFVSEERKRELLARCDAVVFNSDREAFGIVPIEAFASGKPVVGVDEGFTKHQIDDGETGILFDRGASGLRGAVEEMYDREWDPDRLQQAATQYDVSRFGEAWRDLLQL